MTQPKLYIAIREDLKRHYGNRVAADELSRTASYIYATKCARTDEWDRVIYHPDVAEFVPFAFSDTSALSAEQRAACAETRFNGIGFKSPPRELPIPAHAMQPTPSTPEEMRVAAAVEWERNAAAVLAERAAVGAAAVAAGLDPITAIQTHDDARQRARAEAAIHASHKAAHEAIREQAAAAHAAAVAKAEADLAALALDGAQ